MRKLRSIRSKIILTLVVPVVALSALWGLALATPISDARALRSAYGLRDQVGRPCNLMIEVLQIERSHTSEFLAVVPRDGADLRGDRAKTDAAIEQFRQLSAQYHGSGDSADITRSRIADMLTNVAALATLRAGIDAGRVTSEVALDGYSQIIGDAFGVLAAASAFSDITVSRIMDVVVGIRHVGELFSQEDALLTGAVTAGRFGAGEYLQLVRIIGAVRFQVPNAGAALPQEVRAAYTAMLGSPTFTALRALEDRITQVGPSTESVPVTREAWKATFDPVATEIYTFAAEGYDKAVKFAGDAGDRILTRAGAAGLVGLIAVLLSLFVSFRVGSSIVRQLSVLREAASDLAHRRLPRLVARLRAGEQVSMPDDLALLGLADDEIREIAVALREVQRTAINSAVGEAEVRYGMRKMFVNVARRNQTLINRQLEALGRLRPADELPAAQAVQLAVRMRRNADHLVILAGSARTRLTHHPEPLTDLIGRAVGELEDASRIQLADIVPARVPGRAADDVAHLLAELLDNATSFSPPDTPVTVSARRTADGVSVRIEDHGLGLKPATLADLNDRIALVPDFDPADSARLGLYVVAQLAAQRGIRVALHPSNFGGVTAEVTLPPDLVEPLPEANPHPIHATR